MLKPRQHERCFECGKHFTVPGDTPSVLVRNPAVALAKCASCSGTSPDVVRESTVMLRNLRLVDRKTGVFVRAPLTWVEQWKPTVKEEPMVDMSVPESEAKPVSVSFSLSASTGTTAEVVSDPHPRPPELPARQPPRLQAVEKAQPPHRRRAACAAPDGRHRSGVDQRGED